MTLDLVRADEWKYTINNPLFDELIEDIDHNKPDQ